MPDPWAPLPGFEPYDGPKGADHFQPVDRKASDLRVFLHSEAQSVRNADETALSWVTLPSGVTAQLTRKAADRWELALHLGRDFFGIIEGSSREEVLRKAVEQ